jgi:hypothetical protein
MATGRRVANKQFRHAMLLGLDLRRRRRFRQTGDPAAPGLLIAAAKLRCEREEKDVSQRLSSGLFSLAVMTPHDNRKTMSQDELDLRN